MKVYSEDLRRKIVDALERGTPKTEAASLFGVSLSLVPSKPPGRPPKAGEATRKLLEVDLVERPAATAAER